MSVVCNGLLLSTLRRRTHRIFEIGTMKTRMIPSNAHDINNNSNVQQQQQQQQQRSTFNNYTNNNNND
eukprot:6171013-Amphidinium_carterae.1